MSSRACSEMRANAHRLRHSIQWNASISPLPALGESTVAIATWCLCASCRAFTCCIRSWSPVRQLAVLLRPPVSRCLLVSRETASRTTWSTSACSPSCPLIRSRMCCCGCGWRVNGVRPSSSGREADIRASHLYARERHQRASVSLDCSSLFKTTPETIQRQRASIDRPTGALALASLAASPTRSERSSTVVAVQLADNPRDQLHAMVLVAVVQSSERTILNLRRTASEDK